jgi:hypothetical protein
VELNGDVGPNPPQRVGLQRPRRRVELPSIEKGKDCTKAPEEQQEGLNRIQPSNNRAVQHSLESDQMIKYFSCERSYPRCHIRGSTVEDKIISLFPKNPGTDHKNLHEKRHGEIMPIPGDAKSKPSSGR